jgi:CheY-like chemotaxis protein
MLTFENEAFLDEAPSMAMVLVVDDSEMDRRLAGRLLQEDQNLEIMFAEDGAKALSLIGQAEPDVVVTDLQMPYMTGLELVTNVRFRHPRVPVVLMTAHGSEAIAAQALEIGAASYVPKNQLAEKLLETVRDILALSRADRTYERLVECSTRSQFEFQLENDPALVKPLVDLVQQMAMSMEVCEPGAELQLGVALEQALLNAIYHGNLELTAEQLRQPQSIRQSLIDDRRTTTPYSTRRTYVKVNITRQEATFTVRDEGPGFAAPARCPAEVMDHQGNRGLVLIRSFMDDAEFNDKGNELVMVRRRRE